jgi:hypothetical protein
MAQPAYPKRQILIFGESIRSESTGKLHKVAPPGSNRTWNTVYAVEARKRAAIEIL